MGAESHNEAGPQIASREEVVLAFTNAEVQIEESYRLFGEWLGVKQKEYDVPGKEYGRLEYNLDAAELLIEAEMYGDAFPYYEAAEEMLYSERERSGGVTSEELAKLEERVITLRNRE